MLNDQSGVYSDLTGEGSVIAARMAVEDFKAAEKGIKVDIVSADHQNKPDIGASIARQWYDQDGVDAILDVPTSSVALAVNGIAREKNKILINSGGGTSDLTGSHARPTPFTGPTTPGRSLTATGSAMVKRGGDTWFFVTADYAFGHALERDAVSPGDEGGRQGARRRSAIRFPGQDFSSFLLQAQSSKAKVIGAGECRRRFHQRDEAGGGVRPRPGRPEPRRAPGVYHRRSRARPAGGAGPDHDRGVLLGQNDQTRAWSKRFAEKNGGKMPTMVHAGRLCGAHFTISRRSRP